MWKTKQHTNPQWSSVWRLLHQGHDIRAWVSDHVWPRCSFCVQPTPPGKWHLDLTGWMEVNGRKCGCNWQVLGNIKNNNEKREDSSHYYKEREPVSPLAYIQWMTFLKRNFAINALFKKLTWTIKSWSLYLKAKYICLFFVLFLDCCSCININSSEN